MPGTWRRQVADPTHLMENDDMNRSAIEIGGVLLALTFSAAGCMETDPEDEALAGRAQYSVSLLSYTVDGHSVSLQESPAPAEAGASASSAMAAGEATAVASEAAAEGEEGMPTDEGPRSTGVLLDLLIQFQGESPLPGITVDVDLVDAGGTIKDTYHEWVETSGFRSGDERQVELQLEADEFEDGDQFSVEWEAFVPAEDRGEYREFAEAGG